MNTSKLLASASAARKNAYCPDSHYAVGAAVLGADGNVYSGCNVENLSYPAGMCAERVAIGAMVAAGCQRIVAIAVVTADGGTPCGICRQVIHEFSGEDTIVVCADEEAIKLELRAFELLPHAFRSEKLRGASE